MLKRHRNILEIKKRILNNPVTAILGPRQCGKTTIAKLFKFTEYYDLEKPQDLAALENPWQLFNGHKGLIFIDEIQRRPDLFPVLRALVDENNKLKFLISGSASKELIKQSSETLAGRISYFELSGFNLDELKKDKKFKSYNTYWLRGGFPRAYLGRSNEVAFQWLSDYITTFLEKDIPNLGINISGVTLRRFWTMLAHYNGQILNYSELSSNFGISDTTVRRYIEILEGTFMVQCVQPWFANIGKRQVKSPKLYFTDTGIFHSLISILDYKSLLSHPKLGASWETLVLREIKNSKPNCQVYFWHTLSGAEIDFILEHNGELIGIEAKYTDSPKVTSSMKNALIDLKLKKILVVHPGDKSFQMADKIKAIKLLDLEKEILNE
jgi:predicted AAA+ superfamily ATPase